LLSLVKQSNFTAQSFKSNPFISTKNFFMTNLFTHSKLPKLNKRKYILSFIISAALFTASSNLRSQNVLVGLTSNGGIEGKGTAFSINTNGNNFSIIKGFADWGIYPNGSLFKNDDGNFYGMTSRGGTNNTGTIFKMAPSGEMTMLKQLHSTIDGGYPNGSLIKGADGYLYGLTSSGGTNTYGTIFKISASGSYSVIKNLSYAEGANPNGSLTLASDGNFYGITNKGGSNGVGVIFKLTPGGIYSVIHTMNSTTEGANSYSSLTEGKDGNLYGVAYYGGSNSKGTIFKVSTGGILTVLRHLNGSADGANPRGDLIQAKDGNFYGTCYGGGQLSNGTIFKISANGNSYTVIKSFASGTDGGYPYGGLMQDSDGNFYGITRSGGSKSGGTIYKLTTAGVYTVLRHLDYYAEANSSSSVPVKGSDGSLYAMAEGGGSFNFGSIFKITTDGVFTLINTFNGAVLGNSPLFFIYKRKRQCLLLYHISRRRLWPWKYSKNMWW
jgi:uncharacterized repeat protein (TIGR03803 family)